MKNISKLIIRAQHRGTSNVLDVLVLRKHECPHRTLKSLLQLLILLWPVLT